MKHLEDIHRQSDCPKDGRHEAPSDRLACKACCRTDGLALLHAAGCLRCQKGIVESAMAVEAVELEVGRRIQAALESREAPE